MASYLPQGQTSDLNFYFLKIFTPVAASRIICGLWSLVPCWGSDPEETALTASDAVRVSRSRDSRGALVRMRMRPVPRGLSAGGAKTEPGSGEGRAGGEPRCRRGRPKESRRPLPQFRLR